MRLRIGFLLVAMIVSVFAVRLFQLQGVDAQAYVAKARAEGVVTVELPATRGTITDRNGVALADSVDGMMLVADPTVTVKHASQIATIIAHRLGLTGALGTVSEHVDGVYTGRLVGEMLHGPAKAVAVAALAEREDLDLGRCSAYSDSYNDLPMLSAVGDPVAINPDHRLREHARANGWRIRDYRTGRKAARAGVFTAAVAGAVAGTVAAGW